MDKKRVYSIIKILLQRLVAWWRKKNAGRNSGVGEQVDEVEIWIDALQHKQWSIRAEAAKVLARLGDVRAVEPLVQASKDEHLDARVAAIIALGNLGDPRAVEPLIELLEDEERTVRSGAAKALGKIGDVRAVEPLIEVLEDWAARKNAVEALGKIGDTRALAPLVKLLEDKHVDIQVTAIQVLEKFRDASTIVPLIKTLGDVSPAVRNQAEEAIKRLLQHIQTVEPLITALKDRNPTVRKEVTKLLGQLGAVQAIEPLIEAIEDHNKGVRKDAIEALGELGDERAIEPLIGVLGVWDIQWAAVKALDKIGWVPEDDIEKVFYFLARKESAPLVALGVPAIEPLKQILMESDSPSFARKEPVEALKSIYASVDTVLFGEGESNLLTSSTLQNPNVTNLTMPLSHLERIEVWTETYDFHQLERFITYAVNYVGQKHLKDLVEAHIYDDPDKLHPNLRNSLENLCKQVLFHEGQREI